eukprot:g2400.t1
MWWMFLLLSSVMVFFNVYLQHWGIGTLDSVSRWVEQRGEAGCYDSTPFIDAQGKPSILEYARSPAGRLMHILPAGLWSVIAPLQLSPTLRARHPAAHRRLGRLFMFMSASIAIGVFPLIVSGASSFRRSAFVDGSMFAFAAYFLGTGLLAVQCARRKRFSDHRVWILRHVAMGYSVHLQRLVAFPTYWILPCVIPGYTELSANGELLRGDSLLMYFYASVALSVDVFIDLACPQSAAAWPTLKRIVREQRHRVDFVFHVLPMSEHPIGFFAAKAVQVILANSDGTYDDVEGFIDWVFRGQRIILYEQDVDMPLDAREVVSDWALSTSSLSPEKLYSDMKDPAFDEKVLNDLDNRFLVTAVANTPTVLINGIFMMHLAADRHLQDFETFLGAAVTYPSYSHGFYSSDDHSGSLSPWNELEPETRDEYEEMQRERKARQAARERRKFVQAEELVQQQQQLHGLDAQNQHLPPPRQGHPAGAVVGQRTAGSTPSSSLSSSVLGFTTPARYAKPYYAAVSSDWRLPPSNGNSAASTPPPPPPPPQSWWSKLSSSFAAFFPAGPEEEEGADAVSEGETLVARAKAFAAEWAGERGDQKKHLRQQKRLRQDLREGRYWPDIFRRFGWLEAAEAAPDKESAREAGSDAGGVGQRRAGGEPGGEVDQESIHLEETAAANVIALDIFLDLSDHQCAKAWPTLKRAVRDNVDTMEFAFHAVPLSANPVAVGYAKAAYALAEQSGDEEVEKFFDLACSSHRRSRQLKHIVNLQDDNDNSDAAVSHPEVKEPIGDIIVGAGDLLAALKKSSSSTSSHQFDSVMRDSASDHISGQGKISGRSSTLSTNLPIQGRTPAVYLSGEFLAYLDGDEALEIFELFLSSSQLSTISHDDHHDGGSTRYPLWLKVQDAWRSMLDDVRHEESRSDSDGSASTEYYRHEPYRLYADMEDSSGAAAVAAPRAAYDDDTTLRSSDNLLEEEEEEEEEEEKEEYGPPEKSATPGTAVVDDDESSASFSPSSASGTSSQSPGTPSGHSSGSGAEFPSYDDTTGEIRQEQATEHAGKRSPSSAVLLTVGVAGSGRAEPSLPPTTSRPWVASELSGHGGSGELKKETKQLQQQQADLLAPPPSFSLSPPAEAIA